jgi:phage baseplate assembly protein W
MRETDKAIGLLLPYIGKGGEVFNQSYDTMTQIRTNLKNLIMTIKGERWMQPNFGTKIYHKLFDQYNEDFADDIIEDIQREVEYWMPFIDVSGDRIQVFFASQSDMDNYTITIKITYGIMYTPGINDTITFKFSQNGVLSN